MAAQSLVLDTQLSAGVVWWGVTDSVCVVVVVVRTTGSACMRGAVWGIRCFPVFSSFLFLLGIIFSHRCSSRGARRRKDIRLSAGDDQTLLSTSSPPLFIRRCWKSVMQFSSSHTHELVIPTSNSDEGGTRLRRFRRSTSSDLEPQGRAWFSKHLQVALAARSNERGNDRGGKPFRKSVSEIR